MSGALSQIEIEKLENAVKLLEQTTITEKLTKLAGSPIEIMMAKLPDTVSASFQALVNQALTKAAETALWTLENKPGKEASTKTNKLLAAISGAAGGVLGASGLAFELPISTTIIMRAIADIARSEGFDLEKDSTKMQCIAVFGFGSESENDDEIETVYYSSRVALISSMGFLAKDLALIAKKHATKGSKKKAAQEAGSLLAKFIEKVAEKYGITISPKLAGQITMGIGAAAGMITNTMFTDYYQDIARGHFIVLKLEEAHGEEVIKAEYSRLAEERKANRRMRIKHQPA